MAERRSLADAFVLAMQPGGVARQAVRNLGVRLGGDLGALADALAAVAADPSRWQTEDERTAWLYCPDRQTKHVLDGDPAVEHARAHGTDGEMVPCPSCPGPALVRPSEADRG